MTAPLITTRVTFIGGPRDGGHQTVTHHPDDTNVSASPGYHQVAFGPGTAVYQWRPPPGGRRNPPRCRYRCSPGCPAQP